MKALLLLLLLGTINIQMINCQQEPLEFEEDDDDFGHDEENSQEYEEVVNTQAPDEEEDEGDLEFHDDNANTIDPSKADPFQGMSEEEKNQFIRAQQMKMTACILYTQIYTMKEEETLKELIDIYPMENKAQCHDKALATLMAHCYKVASPKDISQLLQNAQNGKFDLEGFLSLTDIDLITLGEEGVDLVLTQEEKHLLKMLKDYQKKVDQQREEAKGGDIEGDRSDSQGEGVKIFGYDTSKLGSGYLFIVFGGVIVIFIFLFSMLSDDEENDVIKKNREKIKARKARRAAKKNSKK